MERWGIATFVLVHGGWGGGWEWSEVARSLRGLGHEVFTPTLTGMGERAHIAEPGLGLETHVDDIVAVLEFEGLHDVVLCGHSYGGVPVTCVADRVPERVRLVIYVDALVPEDGQSALDLLPPSFGELVRVGVGEHGYGWRVEIPDDLLPPSGDVSDTERHRYVARLRDHPAMTFIEPVRLTGAVDQVPRAFLRCTKDDFGDFGPDPIAPLAERAQAEGWPYRELVTPHDPQLLDPVGTAAALHELVTDA